MKNKTSIGNLSTGNYSTGNYSTGNWSTSDYSGFGAFNKPCSVEEWKSAKKHGINVIIEYI
jgi:uncharacterized membrane protein